MTTEAELSKIFNDLLEDFDLEDDPDDVELEPTGPVDQFRLDDMSEFVGQKRLVTTLRIHLEAARIDNKEYLDPVLLHGVPGSGKTTLAHLIATELGVDLIKLIMPATEKALHSAITSGPGVLLLDELHSADKRQQESLFPLLEFGYIQTKSGYRVQADGVTIVGASTERQKILKPLYDRFKIKPEFDPYTDEEMGRIVASMARKVEVELTDGECRALGRACSGVPRNASRLVIGARALALAAGERPSVSDVLRFCDVDADGLERLHYRYLETLAKFGGTKGLRPMATVLRLNESVVMDLEALLFAKDMIQYGNTGRELTSTGYAKIKKGKQ